MLRLEQVSKVYRVGTFGGQELPAATQVSFNVRPGEVVSLIGESGSGKTTIGRMILRLTTASSGRITFGGTDIASLRGGALQEYYRHVQGVFQDPFSSYNPIFKADRVFALIHEQFFPQLSAAEWSDRVEASLKSVGLNPESVLNKFPHQLSGGQLQRFLIARALLLDIEFLVADEIISMLDASTRLDVLNLLGDLKSRGLSILFITHDLSLGYYISERAVILRKGCVVEMGASERVFSNPLHPYTKMLMASIPRLDHKWEEVKREPGSRLSQEGATGACAYYDRCPLADRDCARERPMLRDLEPDHSVACCRC
jgi:peptide/nickel transport system ATP-binding protein